MDVVPDNEEVVDETGFADDSQFVIKPFLQDFVDATVAPPQPLIGELRQIGEGVELLFGKLEIGQD